MKRPLGILLQAMMVLAGGCCEHVWYQSNIREEQLRNDAVAEAASAFKFEIGRWPISVIEINSKAQTNHLEIFPLKQAKFTDGADGDLYVDYETHPYQGACNGYKATAKVAR